MKTHKCRAKDCKRRLEPRYAYCSIECACYDGYYVRLGRQIVINEDKRLLIENENYD